MSNIVLEPARLTGSGRPVLSSAQEVERFLYEGVRKSPNFCYSESRQLTQSALTMCLVMQVDVHFHDRGGVLGQMALRYTGGHVVLTTHNLVWIDAAASPQPGRSCILPLPAVKTAGLRASHMLAQSKLCMQVCVDWQGRPQQDGPLTIEVGTNRPARLKDASLSMQSSA